MLLYRYSPPYFESKEKQPWETKVIPLEASFGKRRDISKEPIDEMHYILRDISLKRMNYKTLRYRMVTELSLPETLKPFGPKPFDNTIYEVSIFIKILEFYRDYIKENEVIFRKTDEMTKLLQTDIILKDNFVYLFSELKDFEKLLKEKIIEEYTKISYGGKEYEN